MSKYRVISKFPCYDGCLPVTGYFVQVLHTGSIFNKWVDIKAFGSKKRAIKFCNLLKKKG